MKNKIIYFFLIFITGNAFSQGLNNSNILVTYTVKVNTDEFSKQRPSSSQVNNRVENVFRAIPTLKFELLANEDESIFGVTEKLNSDLNQGYKGAVMAVRGNEIFYKNGEENLFNTTSLGENINVNRNISYIWKITKESKNILGFNCFKATSSYKTIDLNGEDIEIAVYAWFTPEINISAGPLGFDNLPGIVLEASKNGKFVFKAESVEFTTNGKIEKPKAKINMSEEEFITFVKEKLKEIRDRN